MMRGYSVIGRTMFVVGFHLEPYDEYNSVIVLCYLLFGE